jgi:hypothetical protein
MSTVPTRPVCTAHTAHGLAGPARARGRFAARWHSTGRGPVPMLARPIRRQGRERRLEQGGGGRSDSSVDRRRGGSGTAARATPERALGGGGSAVELTGARPEEQRVAPVVGLVGTGRRGEARGRSGGAQLGRRGGERRWRIPARRRTGWRRGWGRRRAVGGDAVAHDLRGGRRRAVSGGQLGGGHGGVAAYPDNGEGDVARSDKSGQKRSGGGERPAVRADNGGRKRTWRVRTTPLRHGVRAGVGTWQPRGDGGLTGGPLISAISELKFTPG